LIARERNCQSNQYNQNTTFLHYFFGQQVIPKVFALTDSSDVSIANCAPIAHRKNPPAVSLAPDARSASRLHRRRGYASASSPIVGRGTEGNITRSLPAKHNWRRNTPFRLIVIKNDVRYLAFLCLNHEKLRVVRRTVPNINALYICQYKICSQMELCNLQQIVDFFRPAVWPQPHTRKALRVSRIMAQLPIMRRILR
jgi:hypothetical protein